MHFDSCHAYIFYIQLFQKIIKIQINIWRNTFYKERVHVYMCGFLTSSILIDEVNNYTGVILRIACFDLNCPLFTCLDFWHRLSSIPVRLFSKFLQKHFFYVIVFIANWQNWKNRYAPTSRYDFDFLWKSIWKWHLNSLWRNHSTLSCGSNFRIRRSRISISLACSSVWSTESGKSLFTNQL